MRFGARLKCTVSGIASSGRVSLGFTLSEHILPALQELKQSVIQFVAQHLGHLLEPFQTVQLVAL